MTVLIWWLLPVSATVLAVCWAAWVRREPRAPSDAATVDGYARFRAALATPDDAGAARARNATDVPLV